MAESQDQLQSLVIVGLQPKEAAGVAEDLRRAGLDSQIARAGSVVLGSRVALLAAFPEALQEGEQATQAEVTVLWAIQESDLPELERLLPGAPFVLRPVRPAEALVRLRRMGSPGPGTSARLRLGCLEIHPEGGWVRVAGHEVCLTAKEFALLLVLAERAGDFVSPQRLMSEIWPERGHASRTHQVHVRRLRSKLGPAGRAIETRVKLGYRLVPDRLEGPGRA